MNLPGLQLLGVSSPSLNMNPYHQSAVKAWLQYRQKRKTEQVLGLILLVAVTMGDWPHQSLILKFYYFLLRVFIFIPCLYKYAGEDHVGRSSLLYMLKVLEVIPNFLEVIPNFLD